MQKPNGRISLLDRYTWRIVSRFDGIPPSKFEFLMSVTSNVDGNSASFIDCQILKRKHCVFNFVHFSFLSFYLCVLVRHRVIPHGQLASLKLFNGSNIVRQCSLMKFYFTSVYKFIQYLITSLNESFKDIAFQILSK